MTTQLCAELRLQQDRAELVRGVFANACGVVQSLMAAAAELRALGEVRQADAMDALARSADASGALHMRSIMQRQDSGHVVIRSIDVAEVQAAAPALDSVSPDVRDGAADLRKEIYSVLYSAHLLSCDAQAREYGKNLLRQALVDASVDVELAQKRLAAAKRVLG